MSSESTAFKNALLLQQLQKGNESAFTKLYYLYSRQLYLKILKMLKDEDAAKEILQDVFLKVWSNHEKTDLSKSFKSYLYTIAVNKVYDHFRQITKNTSLVNNLASVATELYTHAEEDLISKDNLNLINRAIEKLSPQRKQVYVQCKLEGKSYEEVSRELGISISTIRDHIVKANRIVRGYLLSHQDMTAYIGIISFVWLICI